MVTKARYVPMIVPVSNISMSFQLSGIGDGFTRSFEIVMMVLLGSKCLEQLTNREHKLV